MGGHGPAGLDNHNAHVATSRTKAKECSSPTATGRRPSRPSRLPWCASASPPATRSSGRRCSNGRHAPWQKAPQERQEARQGRSQHPPTPNGPDVWRAHAWRPHPASSHVSRSTNTPTSTDGAGCRHARGATGCPGRSWREEEKETSSKPVPGVYGRWKRADEVFKRGKKD